MRRCPRIMFFASVLCAWALACPCLRAAQKQLELRVRPQSSRVRFAGPIPLYLLFKYRSGQPLAGQVELAFYEGRSLLSRVRTDRFMISGGETTFQVLVPGLEIAGRRPSGQNSVQVEKTFVHEGKRIPLGVDDLLVVGGDAHRTQVIGASWPRNSGGYPQRTLLQLLVLERFAPKGETLPVSTGPAFSDPRDFPRNPLACCGYDVVVLAGRGFSELEPAQLTALLRWVRAGGSIVVAPERDLSPHHLRFLNALAGHAIGVPFYGLTEEGEVGTFWSQRGQQRAPFHLHHTGLGRTMVVLGAMPRRPEEADSAWRRAVAFVWKVDHEQAKHIEADGCWQRKNNAGQLPRAPNYYYRGMQQAPQVTEANGHFYPLTVGDRLLRELLPSRVGLVPFWLILVILLGFVALIGPVDYFLLGKLRQRRLTWILFPATCVGVTFFTMQMSQFCMGATDDRLGLTFLDVDMSGDVVRRSRYEVVFSGRDEILKHEARQDYILPIDHQDFANPYGNGYYYGGYGYRQPRRDPDEPPPCYVGRFATDYTLDQTIHQWDPQMNRTFSLRAETPLPLAIPWDAIPPAQFKTHKGRAAIAERLRQLPQATRVLLLHGQDVWDLNSLSRNTLADQLRAAYGERGWQYYGYRETQSDHTLQNFPLFIPCLISARPHAGLFTVVSQVSPHGGASFEDLALLDATDPQAWLLMILVKQGDDTIVIRRIYHGDTP